MQRRGKKSLRGSQPNDEPPSGVDACQRAARMAQRHRLSFGAQVLDMQLNRLVDE
jgi:hypothetical protein